MKIIKILSGLIVILLITGFADASTLNVGQGQTYTTIQSAMDAASTGDVISVGEGTYNENLVVRTNGILLIGKNKEKTIIDGQKTGSVIRVEANNVVVSGFTLQNNGGSGKEDAGITLYSANGNMVVNSILVNNTIGIAIYSSSNGNVISGNYIRSNYRNGIFVYSSDDNKIYNNNIQNNQIGFYGDAARTSSIYSNNFIDNKDQAYDNSGLNSWDDGKSGNYWSTFKGSGAFNILGGANSKDNYPLSNAVSIKDVAITTPTEKPEDQKDQEETGKSSPGFTGLVSLLSIITAIAFKYGKKDQ